MHGEAAVLGRANHPTQSGATRGYQHTKRCYALEIDDLTVPVCLFVTRVRTGLARCVACLRLVVDAATCYVFSRNARSPGSKITVFKSCILLDHDCLRSWNRDVRETFLQQVRSMRHVFTLTCDRDIDSIVTLPLGYYLQSMDAASCPVMIAR
jgi:hypothetical protein